MKQESLDEELKNLFPRLQGLRQSDGAFRLPEGYFDALEDSVLSRIDAMGARRPALAAQKGAGLPARLFRLPVLTAMAAALALVLAAIWFFRPAAADSHPPAFADLSEEEIEMYVLENIRDFDAEQLASLWPEVTENQPETPATAKHPLDDLSEEELDILLKEMSEEELESLL